MYSPFCMDISAWESSDRCGYPVYSQSIKNNNAMTFQSAVWSCLSAIKRIFYSVCDNGWNMDPSLHSRVKSAVSWVDNKGWKPSKATKNGNVTFRKKEPSIANIIWRYWCVQKKKFWKNDPKWRRIKCFFTRTMHRVISQSQKWQNCTNCTLNCFPIHRIQRIWLPATTTCLQT